MHIVSLLKPSLHREYRSLPGRRFDTLSIVFCVACVCRHLPAVFEGRMMLAYVAMHSSFSAVQSGRPAHTNYLRRGSKASGYHFDPLAVEMGVLQFSHHSLIEY